MKGVNDLPKYMVVLHTDDEGTWAQFFEEYSEANDYAMTGEMALNAHTELYERTHYRYRLIK